LEKARKAINPIREKTDKKSVRDKREAQKKEADLRTPD